MSSSQLDPPAESHLVIHDGQVAGRVTSCCQSPTLEAVVGLALVAHEIARPGSDIDIRCAGGRVRRAEIVPLPFYDPGNERQKC